MARMPPKNEPCLPPEGCTGRGCQAEILRSKLHGRVSRVSGESLELNMTGPSWKLWRNDESGSPCVSYETRFGQGLARVWLVSFPSSGNTWARYLLEGATGVFTGSVYDDRTLYEAGFLGELDAANGGRTIVQKNHGSALFGHPVHDLSGRYARVNPDLPAILILRNPARAIISYWKFFVSKAKNRHMAQVLPELFSSEAFRDFVAETTSLWEELATDRLLWSSGPLHVIHYEHLLQNTTHHLRQMLHFLRVPVDEGRLWCVSSHLAGSFKRTNNKDLEPFTKEEKVRMSIAVKRVARILLLLGYPQPPQYPELLL
ncbi:sialate:O-sulfotransferase 1-like [Panulirus ornatus]|uniref:sialate:O-sulfotransferase 1-like n=1 Tax=Panulirus ornatus TaxID=150431 RepID=UPI003A857241